MARKKHKKRAWNNTNPLYRYLQSKKAKAKPKRNKKGGSNMAKRRRRSHRASRSMGGLGLNRGIMGGLYKPTGMIDKALVGIGSATVAKTILPTVIPFQDEAIGFVTGGVVGAGAVLLAKNLPSIIGGTNVASQGQIYY